MEENLLEVITLERILPELSATGKKEALLELVAALDPKLSHEEIQEIYLVLKDRESLGSTGIGEGIAIPHGKIRDLEKIKICFGRSSAGIPFDAVDGKPVHLFFLMLAPEKTAGPYLKALARLSRFLKKENNRARLISAADTEALAAILAQA